MSTNKEEMYLILQDVLRNYFDDLPEGISEKWEKGELNLVEWHKEQEEADATRQLKRAKRNEEKENRRPNGS